MNTPYKYIVEIESNEEEIDLVEQEIEELLDYNCGSSVRISLIQIESTEGDH